MNGPIFVRADYMLHINWVEVMSFSPSLTDGQKAVVVDILLATIYEATKKEVIRQLKQSDFL